MFDADNLKEKSGKRFYSPSEIIIHHDWNPFDEIYDADIALLIIEDELIMTKAFQPICLWEFSSEPNGGFYLGLGFIAYWREVDTAIANEIIPKQLKIQLEILFGNKCKLTSNRTFCGGSIDGSVLCRSNLFNLRKFFVFQNLQNAFR